jgi:hypothetical protein
MWEPFSSRGRPRIVRKLAFSLVVLALSSGCRSASPAVSSADVFTASDTTRSTTPTELELWKALGIDDYRISFSIQNLNGMGEGEHNVYSFEVRYGEIANCRVEPLDGPVDRAGLCNDLAFAPGYSPVVYLFSRLNQFDPRYTSVIYDPQWHLPTHVSYDRPDVVDEEMEIELLLFEATAPEP